MNRNPETQIAADRLFVLAGFRGAGKSTLLGSSLEQGLPLFGEADDAAFRRTRLPPLLDDSAVPLARCISTGCWIAEANLAELATMPVLPPTLVVHLDLVSILVLTKGGRTNEPARLIRLLSSPGAIDRMISGFAAWFAERIAARYARCIVTTLLTEPAELRRRTATRGYTPESLNGMLFGAETLEVMHAGFYEAWQSAQKILRPDLAFHCRTEGHQLVMWPSGQLEVAPPVRGAGPAAAAVLN